MKLKSKLFVVLIVLMLIPTIALAKEVTDNENYKIDVPDTYEEIAENQYRKKDNGENFSVFTSEPLENPNLTEEEFKVITDYVVDQIKSEGRYTVKHLGNEIVTVTKNNYKAYLAKFQMTAGSIDMILRQYYFVTPEKSVLFTETRFSEEDYETEEAQEILDSLTLLNCTPTIGQKNSLISEKVTEPEDKSSALITEKTDVAEEPELIAKKGDTEVAKTDYVLPCVIIVVAVIAVIIIKKVTAKKPNNTDDNSNL